MLVLSICSCVDFLNLEAQGLSFSSEHNIQNAVIWNECKSYKFYGVV